MTKIPKKLFLISLLWLKKWKLYFLKKGTIKDKEKLYPFKPFSLNSEGGISTLIYEADQKGRDIEMKLLDLFKILLVGLLGLNLIFSIEKINSWEWRAKGINYKVDYNIHYDRLSKIWKWRGERNENTICNW